MTDKKAETQNEVKQIGKVEILIYDNGEVSVNGPLKNLPVMINVLGKAMCAVAVFSAKESQSDIVSV